MAGSDYVVLEDVTIRYEARGLPPVEVASGLSMTVPRGATVAVLGPSGSGKSSVLNVMSGLVRPSSGTVVVDDLRLNELDAERLGEFRRTHIGFVFQAFHLLPHLTALENVQLGAMIRGVATHIAKERAESAINEVGLAHRRSHRPAQLSGGEQQRIALARVYAAEPQLVLADEPTGNLDPAATELVLEAIGRLRSMLNATVVLATHSAEVAAFADTRIHLNAAARETNPVRLPA